MSWGLKLAVSGVFPFSRHIKYEWDWCWMMNVKDLWQKSDDSLDMPISSFNLLMPFVLFITVKQSIAVWPWLYLDCGWPFEQMNQFFIALQQGQLCDCSPRLPSFLWEKWFRDDSAFLSCWLRCLWSELSSTLRSNSMINDLLFVWWTWWATSSTKKDLTMLLLQGWLH